MVYFGSLGRSTQSQPSLVTCHISLLAVRPDRGGSGLGFELASSDSQGPYKTLTLDHGLDSWLNYGLDNGQKFQFSGIRTCVHINQQQSCEISSWKYICRLQSLLLSQLCSPQMMSRYCVIESRVQSVVQSRVQSLIQSLIQSRVQGTGVVLARLGTGFTARSLKGPPTMPLLWPCTHPLSSLNAPTVSYQFQIHLL